MRRLLQHISRLNRTAERCDDLAGCRFSQASVSSELQGDLIDQGLAYKLEADRLRIRAARMLRRVPLPLPLPLLTAEC